MNIHTLIRALVDYAIDCELACREDESYMINSLLTTLGLTEYAEPEEKVSGLPLDRILGQMCDYAYEQGLIESNTVVYRDLYDTALMNAVTPRPGEVIRTFRTLYKNDPEAATDYFYKLSRDCNYIRTDRIAKNLCWQYEGKYGTLDITVNLSKPEKDPKAIAAARLLPPSGYPKCALCHENEGYAGTVSRAARQTLRQIPITMAGQAWYLQYSPYVYYNEHCIALSAEHRPMKIDRAMFEKLLDFVEIFPHYFIGSNADLPIVGGSILSHDHMQGGHYTFAMARVGKESDLWFRGFEDVQAELLHWPLTTIRLRSTGKARLVALADKILTAWRSYTDADAMIFAETEGKPHNTITPIARMAQDGKRYELDLVLRNNLTTDEHPLGLYHPHEEKHHIKKENIGLIEVMGLAVLPARLSSEMELLKTAILNGTDPASIPELEKHAAWAEQLKKQYTFTEQNTADILRREIGRVFEAVLEDAGVYRCTPEGRAAFARFVDTVNAQ
ncbi:MAG: UDP-glucose--hexose-1-phosphate uridylyltransferase [Clostridia bacterium]|nr:UDP-glucose--hexose-1-phosphate uridylyltransferase [Clostridia bacterium]